jgi:hypothetical protein
MRVSPRWSLDSEWPFRGNSFAHRRRFEVRPFGYSFQNCQQLSANGRFHLALPFSTNSANGGLQSTSVTGPEKRQRRVWVGYGRPVSGDDRRVYDVHRSLNGAWQLSVNLRPLGRIA